MRNPLSEPIAVVGSGCRFPGSSTSPSALWELLSKPRDVSQDIPDDRFELRGHYHPKSANHGTTNVQRAYFVEGDPRLFDAAFFNISPNEAESIDPQQRLLMEVVYEALEAGGHAMEDLRGSDTAFYVGTMSVDYNDIVLRDPESTPTYFATGASRAVISNRVSYFFDWHGPSMTIDTACSSSLVALHLGVQSLRSGESRIAVAGGTNLLLAPDQFVSESNMSMLSPLGHSRMWDADADGYARGDGIAALVLKKLSDAVADGDHIECVIRETGVNQDGKSTGLTVPSSEAQAALIRDTYAKAGLNIDDPQNWPQYFEAHGTGTKAGDPREAAAIHRCFGRPSTSGNPLYVGSIKTLIGHTEGTAGLAGVLKASLSVQRGVIAPNMYLERLNPDIEQYYDHLRVPTIPTHWPSTPEGAPRRASVNSFGFGGTNAHAIIESYRPQVKPTLANTAESEAMPFTPFTFSGATEESLNDLLRQYSDFCKKGFTGNLCDLAWTLQSRRSALPIKAAFSASTWQDLTSKIDTTLSQTTQDASKSLGTRSNPAKPRILGVFTGQGAQWASMGAQLIHHAAYVREKLAELDHSLATLPEADRPAWKIADQLCAGKETSRIGEAALSQPLCTAVQIVLVDLLKSAGITFAAVVGHSSGEIGAAYAADFISAHDAIRIAYYRGLYAKLAKGPKGQAGAMLAVGTSWEDAEDLIGLPALAGRAKIAAQNSAASLTLSGDADGIEHAKRVFDEEKKFARVLRVDTAYHSHHMLPASDAYVSSLRACGIQINRQRKSTCTWYSSVKSGEAMEPVQELDSLYWRDNMVNAVLFTDAIEKAAADGSINLAIEVGPHPALKGPAQQTISGLRSTSLPYTGVLFRGTNDVDAFSDALGFIWCHLGQGSVDFEAYQRLMSPGTSSKMVVGLPSYPWSHKRFLLHESRIAKNRRLRGSAFHELLGVPDVNNTEGVLRWRNFLKPSEIPWLDGHQLQGQTVFPAAGYVAMALEAGKNLAGERNIQVLEVRDLVIGKAITFDEGATFAAETLVSLTDITPSKKNAKKSQTANFSVYSCPNTGTVDLDLVAEGTISIVYGSPSFSTLSSTPIDPSNFAQVDRDAFYTSLFDLGYGYNGPFRTLDSLQRRLGQASASVSTYEYADEEDILMVHPTMLDVAFQASFLALSAPGDERLWSLHVPTSIKCIRVNPELCASLPMASTRLPLSTVLHEPDSASFCSSIDVFSRDGQQALLQVEELTLKPFSPATAADDRPVYSTTCFGVSEPDGNLAVSSDGTTRQPCADESGISILCERFAYHCLRNWHSSGEAPNEALLGLASQVLAGVENGRQLSVSPKWTSDTWEQIESWMARYPNSADLSALQSIQEGITPETIGTNGALDALYETGVGFAAYNTFLARLMQQISHRYPHANILEVGARGGHATKAIFQSIGTTFASYTYTDPSAEYLDKASATFGAQSPKINFQVFDPASCSSGSLEGPKENFYDVIIASNLLHSLQTPEEALQKLRRLLRPGGYLLMSGLTGNAPLRIQMMMAGRVLPPHVGASGDSRKRIASWHSLFRRTGFSGVDTVTPEMDALTWPLSVMATQAVDNKVSMLRNPTSSSSSLHLTELVILGNESLQTSQLAETISDLARPFCSKVTLIQGLPTDDDQVTPMSVFINLVDLDEPIFEKFDEAKMEGLKRLFELASNIVWVTQGARADQPYHNASVGFGRALAYEMPHVFLQFLDLDAHMHLNDQASRLITEAALRLAAMSEWDTKGKLLWSKEPELFVEDGQIVIPRVMAQPHQNRRINALRRTVSKEVDPSASAVSIVRDPETKSFSLREELMPLRGGTGDGAVEFTRSVVSALKVSPEAFLYVGYGTLKATGDAVVAVSTALGSKVRSVASVPVEVSSDKVSTLLATTTAELLAAALLSEVPSSCRLLVHEPFRDDFFVEVLKHRASEKKVTVFFSSSSSSSSFSSEKEEADDPISIKLSPWTSSHLLKQAIPSNTTHFIDLSNALHQKEGYNALDLGQILPYNCRELHMKDLLRYESSSRPGSLDQATITQTLMEAVKRAQEDHEWEIKSQGEIRTIGAGEIGNTSSSTSVLPLSVIDWTSDGTVSVEVQPIDASRLFAKDKTYLLVGLTGELGTSICEWMARHGAGHIVLTSRQPKPDPKWEASITALGASVKIFAMDVTIRQEVERVVGEIRATCPPIAGVANGAALFRDTPFSEMTLDMMQDVLKPKIDGTNFLDELFNGPELEFFIVFSSIAFVTGNSAQSNYCAANGYMSALCNRRRKRGLAASSLEIGRVMGIGYVERAGQKAKDQLVRFGAMSISETDLHHLMAEAVLASAPDGSAVSSVTTGCRTVPYDEEPRVAWFDNPRFGHKIIIELSGGQLQGDGQRNLPVRDQLAAVTSSEQALEVIKDCFAAKLATISQLTEVSHTTPLVELGIDSLVAVEVRGWFLKELKTDMPVLKVLGGGSVVDLCTQALEKMPQDLLPNVGGKASPDEKTTSKQHENDASRPSTLVATTSSPSRGAEAESLSATEGSSSTSDSTSAPSTSDSPPRTPSTPFHEAASSLDLAGVTKKATELQSQAQTERSAFMKSELLSFPQSRFWFLAKLLDDQTTFNISILCHISGNLRIGDLERAVRLVGTRHESLRTCFVADDNEPDLAYQKVLPTSQLRLERRDVTDAEQVHKEFEAMKTYPYDLTRGDMMRLLLLSLSPTDHYLIVGYHHILMDGVSFQVFLSDVERVYQRRPLGLPPRQLPDVSRSQRTAFENGEMDGEIAYWRNEFPDGHHPVLPLLPMAKTTTRMPMNSFDFNQVMLWIPPDVASLVRQRAMALRATTFHFYLAVFRTMLARLSGATDLTIGIADANRSGSDDLMGVVGLLLNLLTLRFQSKPGQSFNDSVAETRDKSYDALKNSRVPFDVLLQEINVPRSSSYSPFFQAFFDYRQGAQEKRKFGSTDLHFLELHPGRTAYDLTLDVTESPDSLVVLFRTQSGLYDQAATQLLADTYVHLVQAFAADTTMLLEEPSLFSDKTLQDSISIGRGPNLPSSWPGGTLPHRIDQVVQDSGKNIALKDGHGTVLTYEAMAERIQAIAEGLKRANVGPGSRVLVYQDATADWPCSMLAIMRLGALYVPLDLRNPLPRLADVASSSQPDAILVDNTTASTVPQINVTQAKVVNVSELPSYTSASIPISAQPDSPAAILFTSGSTGKPKGIVVKHSGLRNEIEGYTTQWGLDREPQRVLQQSAFTFNHSSDQIYTALVNGGSVYIVPWSKRGDPMEITKLIMEEHITYTKATPAEYLMWLDYGHSHLLQASAWRFAFGGGESLTVPLVEKLAALNLPHLRFFNSYGPTEISISSTKMEIQYREKQPDGRIPCGYSLPNYTAYILDQQRSPVPVGVPGNLWIGGAGVSLGYLHDKELTEASFATDPYATPYYVEQGWTRMYHTGDVAHLRPDGAMVFHHRVAGDSQVKIRGLRIELGDIESNIVKAAKGTLSEAAVTLREEESETPFLVAHVVFSPQHTIPNQEAYLQSLLNGLDVPQYMIPAMAVPLERLPLNNHSKVDRSVLKTLPLPQSKPEQASGEMEDLTETMTQLKRLWEDVLGAQKLGLKVTPSTNFFAVGGNSLLIVRLQSRVRSVFGVTVRLVDLLGASTLAEMAKLVEDSTTMDSIDWDKELRLPEVMARSSVAEPVKRTTPRPETTTGRVLLVTGAGGFLGQHILARLVQDDSVRAIHCVGLRDKPPGTRRTLAVSSPKIVTYAGDLSDPRMGLSAAEFAALASHVDGILHMGAVRSFWDHYHLLRPSNVTPTKTLIQLAAARHIPIHYVSTAGVLELERWAAAAAAAQLEGQMQMQMQVDGQQQLELEAAPPPPSDANGYVVSRWASEQLLARAAAVLGVPTTIHRFVPAAHPSAAATDQAVQDLLGFAEQLSVLPSFSGSGHFEMTPAEQASSELCQSLLSTLGDSDEASGHDADGRLARFVHHECEVQVDVSEFQARLAVWRQGQKKSLDSMPGLRFVGRAKALGLKYFVTSHTLLMAEDSGQGLVLESKR